MNAEKHLKNKVALVTGSGRGIGRAIALRLAQAGANLVITYNRNIQPAEEVAHEIETLGRKALVIRTNVAKPDDISALFSHINHEFNGLDIFINNAASGFNRPALEQKIKGWDYTMEVNCRAFLLAAQEAVPLMEKRGGGNFIAISSPGSTRVLPDYVAVGASKAALESLTRYLAVELAEKNIVVNAIAPGMVKTDALQHFAVLKEDTVMQHVSENTPAGRLVTPEDVAGLALFLCSPDACMIRGQIITLDGGFTLLTPR